MELKILMATTAILFVAAVATLGYDWYRRKFCRHCGAKMDVFYDVEEDAVVYQCPKCGRTYIYE